jgi:hypothetical protein
MRRRLAVVASLTLLLAGCGGATTEPDLGATPPPAEDLTEDPAGDPAEDPDDEPEPAPTDAGDGDDGPAEPDPDELADPCAGHEDRTDEAFIELVSPVDGQRVTGDELRLVGCSNVFEANISYRLLDGDGRTLEEGFTTAECGTGCVGAFDETVDLSVADGEPVVYVQVFWGSPEDGRDLDLVERIVVLS